MLIRRSLIVVILLIWTSPLAARAAEQRSGPSTRSADPSPAARERDSEARRLDLESTARGRRTERADPFNRSGAFIRNPKVGRGPEDLYGTRPLAETAALARAQRPGYTAGSLGALRDIPSLTEFRQRIGRLEGNANDVSRQLNELDARWNRQRVLLGYGPSSGPADGPHRRAHVAPYRSFREDSVDRWMQRQITRQRLLRPQYPYFGPRSYSESRRAYYNDPYRPGGRR